MAYNILVRNPFFVGMNKMGRYRFIVMNKFKMDYKFSLSSFLFNSIINIDLQLSSFPISASCDAEEDDDHHSLYMLLPSVLCQFKPGGLLTHWAYPI